MREHVARRATAVHPLTGPLILPLDEIAAAIPLAEAAGAGQDGEPPIALSIVTPSGRLEDALHAVDGTSALRLHAIELKTDPEPGAWRTELPPVAQAAAAEGAPEIFVELTADQVADGALEAIAGTAVRLKYRTGGVRKDLFPSPEQLASVLHEAVERGLSLKLTAGLHQAVRFTHPATGFTHHGFLNIAVAILRAQAGEDQARLVEALRSRDAEAVVAEAGRSDAWRDVYRSFGTCDIPEPVESLQSLGLLPADLLDGYRQTLAATAPAADDPTPKE
ncbi:hypothetical protein [Micrococcus sp.]|uniref:hypothetical protein n=1 Tax=Micrococcus sp. TaxID=1271 RepID=UPI0026DCC389|nr:hypothetical protein [Micrococcus sp.]MDO4238761.1 hypothetical protein [Micrococcus sp.]